MTSYMREVISFLKPSIDREILPLPWADVRKFNSLRPANTTRHKKTLRDDAGSPSEEEDAEATARKRLSILAAKVQVWKSLMEKGIGDSGNVPSSLPHFSAHTVIAPLRPDELLAELNALKEEITRGPADCRVREEHASKTLRS